MKVKYAPEFKPLYLKLPPGIQRQFLFVDARVCAGNLDTFRREGWMYVANLGLDHAAFGSVKDDGKVFYWIFIGSARDVPVIL